MSHDSIAARAWDEGFEAAAEYAGDCCGCNAYNADISNPYAGDAVITPKVEVIEYAHRTQEGEVVGHVMTALSINGVEFHCPIGSSVAVESEVDGLTQVTATFFVSEVHVRHKAR